MCDNLKIDDIFIIPNCDGKNKYKVYCIKEYTGRIIYIGCTMVTMRQRISGHLADTFNVGSKKQIILDHIKDNNKLTIEILYDFKDKFHAGITERILINFYKNYVDGSVLNKKCEFSELNFIGPYNSIKHY